MEKANLFRAGVFAFITLSIIAILFFSSNLDYVFGDIGSPNVTVHTQLQIGNVYPEILLVSAPSPITLSPNTTVPYYCYAVVRDYNGENDVNIVYAQLFNTAAGSYGAGDDNNYHYNNSNCTLQKSFTSYGGITDDAYMVLANCSFNISYYANPGTWNCSIDANDTANLHDFNSSTTTVSNLISLGVPSIINYGKVNATLVSDEASELVTNFGNVGINLSLQGYGATPNDNLSMNCSLGNVQNISIIYERFNMTSNPGSVASLSAFNGQYRNLTSTNATIAKFDLGARQNDTINDAYNNTYWRIYVPRGVAGNCTGNIIFGAVLANGT